MRKLPAYIHVIFEAIVVFFIVTLVFSDVRKESLKRQIVASPVIGNISEDGYVHVAIIKRVDQIKNGAIRDCCYTLSYDSIAVDCDGNKFKLYTIWK
jgi:hypothetical protein